MNRFLVQGKVCLRGEVEISGAKNAAVAILPAAMLVDGVCIIENVPKISDVLNIVEIMNSMGAVAEWVDNTNTLRVDCRNITSCEVSYEHAKKLRASYYFMGALLGRCGKSIVALPGGCNLGGRPIDQHEKVFEALGATVVTEGGSVHCHAPSLNSAHIYFDMVSVGATINAMLAACKAKGLTVLENVAKEPHVVDVANFLNSMGANISGAGTNVIKIRGVARLGGGSYAIIPDQIEAGTYMAAAAATRGNVLVKNVIPKHMECISGKLREMGVTVEEYDDSIRVRVEEGAILRHAQVKTAVYPGFPTDMQPQIAVLMATVEGISRVTENIWGSRFRYVEELKRMGAKITVDGKSAVIEGGRSLSAAPLHACDLRAGAALIIAACTAEGSSYIEEIEFVERGYENVVEKFNALGANIQKITD
ncbi:MAG: UDP-N-acetylglucosamine 1-carboxyvinyltransferase [Clostridia bacterium]|nr:UDP-N-acetylglucosamine 1-carboxyvinyltransferase [Clostridia bacterium]